MANATCAACGEPIATGGRFKIAGTEVFHDVCVRNFNQSVRHRLEHAFAQTSESMRRLMEKNEKLENERRAFDRRLDTVEAEMRDSMNAVAQNRQRLSSMSAELTTVKLQRDAANQELAIANQRITEFQAANARLAREVEQLRSRVPQDTTRPAETGSASSKDDTEIRFSLLEIDPT